MVLISGAVSGGGGRVELILVAATLGADMGPAEGAGAGTGMTLIEAVATIDGFTDVLICSNFKCLRDKEVTLPRLLN